MLETQLVTASNYVFTVSTIIALRRTPSVLRTHTPFISGHRVRTNQASSWRSVMGMPELQGSAAGPNLSRRCLGLSDFGSRTNRLQEYAADDTVSSPTLKFLQRRFKDSVC